MAELADALDSKSSGKPCGFESHHRYQDKNVTKVTFFLEIKRWDSKRNVPSLGWFKASLNAGKNSPVDYFCDASASGPTIGTRIKKCRIKEIKIETVYTIFLDLYYNIVIK